jgi:hypothetical protein
MKQQHLKITNFLLFLSFMFYMKNSIKNINEVTWSLFLLSPIILSQLFLNNTKSIQ